MQPVDLIRRKRDGGALDRADIETFIAGVTDGSFKERSKNGGLQPSLALTRPRQPLSAYATRSHLNGN